MTFCSSEKPFLPWPTLCAKLTQSLFLRKIKARATSGLKSFLAKKWLSLHCLLIFYLLASSLMLLASEWKWSMTAFGDNWQLLFSCNEQANTSSKDRSSFKKKLPIFAFWNPCTVFKNYPKCLIFASEASNLNFQKKPLENRFCPL